MRERRPTPHGFDVELGWADDDLPEAGNVPGAPRVILTPPLADYLRMAMQHPKTVDLPICIKSARQLARRAGVPDYRTLRMRWWAARRDDLSHLPTAEFRTRHGMSKSRVDGVRKQVQGRSKRAPGWYREPKNRRVILAYPQKEAARRLGVSVQAVSAARWRLRQGR